MTSRLVLVSMIKFRRVIALALLAWVQQAFATKPDDTEMPTGSILDPLFGISMAWGTVPFDKAPESIYSCDPLKSQPRGYLFLFGSTTRNGVTYSLVHGWKRVKDEASADETAYVEQDVTPTIVMIENGHCAGTVSDGYAWSKNPRDRSLAMSKYGITDAVATALLDDGFQRAVRAFGGAQPFLKKLDENSATTNLGQLDYLTKKVSTLRGSVAQTAH